METIQLFKERIMPIMTQMADKHIQRMRRFIIPLLCHFNKQGQENAQNTRPLYTVVHVPV